MVKAIFTKEQQSVNIKTLDGKDFIYICLNGEEKTDEESGSSYFEYDYNEIICPTGTLDLEDVAANPENYIDYVYEEEAELTITEQLNDIQLAMTELYEMMIGK
ncbi:MAG: hypothetical protein LUH47_11200 [Clostridiales bacterium]|nr:hypothetical protein [Clostridiales bacterium]